MNIFGKMTFDAKPFFYTFKNLLEIRNRIFILTLLLATLLVSCKTNDTSLPITPLNNNMSRESGRGITIFKVELHRYKGHMRREPYSACNCVHCFGMCDAVILGIPLRTTSESENNVILEKTSASTGVIYILEEPDLDVTVDPTFYVDTTVTVFTSDDTMKILPSNYPFNNSGGTLTIDSVSYDYHGTVNVSIE